MSAIDLVAIRGRLARIYPGPWRARKRHDHHGYTIHADMGTAILQTKRAVDKDEVEHSKGNAEFIACAPEDIRALLDEVMRLRKGIQEAVVGDVRKWDKDSGPFGAFAKCVHSVSHSEDCENCITDYLKELLDGKA